MLSFDPEGNHHLLARLQSYIDRDQQTEFFVIFHLSEYCKITPKSNNRKSHKPAQRK